MHVEALENVWRWVAWEKINPLFIVEAEHQIDGNMSRKIDLNFTSESSHISHSPAL